ncbi:MAG: hypothetical protein ACI9QC_000643 [Oceanicoccus sp.]|jgi:hypothetical protein
MKKVLYALLAIAILGGIAFGLSQSNLLKGDFDEITTIEDESGGESNDIWSGGTIETGTDGTGFEPGGVLDFNPPTGGTTGGGTDCEPEYWLSLSVNTVDGNSLDSLTTSKFSVETTSGSDVASQFGFENDNGEYEFLYSGTSPSDQYNVIVDANGYQEATATVDIISSCSDVRSSTLLEVEYNHTVTLKDHNGNYLNDADVSTGSSYSSTCDYWDEEDKYVCATPDSGDKQYRTAYTGYVTKEGSFISGGKTALEGFSSDSRFASKINLFSQTLKSLSNLGYANLLAAINGDVRDTSSQQNEVNAAIDAATAETSTTTSSTETVTEATTEVTTDLNTLPAGISSDHKTITMNEFAWTISLTDGSEYITGATVKMTTPASDTYDCDYQENGLYWCSGTSYFTTSGNNTPSYEVSASGYDTETGNFALSRSARTDDGVNQDVVLSLTDNTDPAIYCDTLDISSGDLPLEYDATEVGYIDFDLEVISSNESFEDELTLTVSGSGTIQGETTYTETVNGTFYYSTYTYSDGSVGDTITASTSYCSDAVLEITQNDAPVDDGPVYDGEYALSCSSVDITPDAYEIYATASDSYYHEFEIEWTVVEQLIALREAPEWIKRGFAHKHDLNPLIMLSDESGFDPVTLTIATTGNGDLYFEDKATAYTELSFDIEAAENDSLIFYYSGADGGDSLYVTSSDSACSDSLNLTEEDEEKEETTTVVEDDDDEDIDFNEIIDGCNDYPFTDVDDNDDLAPYIYCLADAGAVQGYGDGSYGPSNQITNAELIKIVVAMTGKSLVSSSTDTDFLDIEGHWAERYIKTAEQNDIARPLENLYFYPDAPADRTFLALALVRAAEQTLWGWDSDDIPFSDVNSTDPEAYAVILLADAEGEVPGVGEETIIEGYSDGTFRGTNSIRRDEAAAMMIRAFYAWFL